MYKPKQKVYIANSEQKHKRFAGAYGTVIHVLPAAHRNDEWKDGADLVTVLFENYDGFLSISEDFNEVELDTERRSSAEDLRGEWERERRSRRGGWFARFRSSGSFVNTGIHNA